MGASSGQNDNRYDDFMKRVAARGRELAEGGDSLPKLALDVAEMANDKVISLDKDQDGKDDAAKIYDRYVEAASKKSIHDHTANGKKANVSKLRQFITLGINPKFDGVKVLNDSVIARQELITADIKVRPAYHAMVEVAREQNKRDDELSTDELKALVRKPDPADKTEEGEIQRSFDILDSLITGEKGVTSTKQEVIDAHSQLRGLLATMALSKEIQETLAKAKELGLNVTAQDVQEAMAEAAE